MFSEQLKKLRNERGYTQEMLANAIGVAKSTISMYENNNREPDFETLEAIADVFNVNMSVLVDNSVPVSKGKGVKIPVLGYVRAGLPIDAVEEVLDYEEITPDMAAHGEHFGLTIKGDSMEPRMVDGDVVIVRKQETVENGDTAVVLVNGDEATVKKFYRTDAGIKLVATNPKYDPLFYTPDEVNTLPVQIIGKVVELRAKF